MMSSASSSHSKPVLSVLFIVISLTLSPCIVKGQQVILNTRGERIVVYPDGSWRYFERGDSTLLNKNLMKEDVLVPDDTVQAGAAQASTMNLASDTDLSALSMRFAERVASDLEGARHTLTKTLEDKFEVEARLNQAQENKKLIEPDIIAGLDEEHEQLTASVKEARKHVKWIEKMQKKTQQMLALPLDKKPTSLNKLIAEYDAHKMGSSASASQQAPLVTSPANIPALHHGTNPAGSIPEVRNPTPSPSEDAGSYHRAPIPCLYAPQQSAARGSVTMEKQLLFTHTDEDLRPYFRQQELLTCFAALVQIEGNLYLSLDFQIASTDARKNFGILENNSMLRLKLMNGTFVNVFNSRADQGRIDAYTGNTIYTGNYLIDREAEKELSKYELDKLRVVWSTGFEDYDIVNLDFLINQFACLRAQ